ncbi:hypothetical protein Tco_1367805 [Tanacetum coccineum]
METQKPLLKDEDMKKYQSAIQWFRHLYDVKMIFRKPKRKDTQVPQPTNPIENVAYEVVHKELGDSLVRVATTASSLEAKHDSAVKMSVCYRLIDYDYYFGFKDKGKGIMIEEPVKPMQKKDQICFDEEVALKLQAEFDEEERLARDKDEKEKEANIALIETWDDIQAKIDVDYQLAKRLQTQEQEELSAAEKATLFQ